MISSRSRTLALLSAIALALAWAAFLFLQPGQPYDEAEHAHAAWLVARLGQRPVLDFFQHHQPLLWDLLRPVWALGFDGPEVLYAGRALVVLSLVPLALVLKRIGNHAALPALALLAVFGVEFPDFLTLRPESAALGLTSLALLAWLRSPRLSFLAGVLYGAALFTSLRFVLLAPAFLLLSEQPWPGLRRALAAIAGALVFWAIYPPLAGVPFSVLLFDLRFSAYLQKVGVGSENVWPVFETWSIALLALAVLAWRSPPAARRKSLVFLAFAVVLFAACRVIAGHYTYIQAFIPALVWLSLAAASIARDVEVPLASVAAIAGAAWLGWNTALLVDAGDTLPAQVHTRREILDVLRPGDTILARPFLHPITARDGSFYGTPLVDSPDRLCVAVRGFPGTMSLPPCDYTSEIEAHPPKLLDEGLLDVVPAAQRSELQRFLLEHYVRVPSLFDPPPWKRTLWMRRN